MPRLPLVSGLKVAKALGKIGFAFDHQTGSHMILRQVDAPHQRVTVPKHGEVARGILRAIIRQANLNVEDFLKLL